MKRSPNAPSDLRLDHSRVARTGFPEVVFGLAKTEEQVVRAVSGLADSPHGVLATRITPPAAAQLNERFPQGHWHEEAGIFSVAGEKAFPPAGSVFVAAAGSSDRGVAEEAAVSAEFFGARVGRAYDVGVAGLHRIVEERESMEDADVVIVVAGMEGALPSVVGGLVSSCVIAVPTSVGYGAAFEGVAALLAMLNCCAPGIVVTNIDNGFGAAVAAVKIARLAVAAPQ